MFAVRRRLVPFQSPQHPTLTLRSVRGPRRQHPFPLRRHFHSPPPPPPRPAAPHLTYHPASPRRASNSPYILVLVFVATGCYYIASTYLLAKDAPPSSSPSSPASTWEITSAPRAQHTMAPTMPPGRPGNLTAEQETKLKEMWTQTLEVFGVSHETHDTANGAQQAATPATPEKKMRRSKLAFLGKKDVEVKSAEPPSSPADGGGDNDKHGQTKEFQQALVSQTPEQLRDAFWSMVKHDHPDALLLRFLRARKWDVQAALIMLVSTMHWRSQEMKVDEDIMIHGEVAALKDAGQSGDVAAKKEGEDFLAQLRLGKSFVHGVDKEGRPCCFVRVRLHRQGEQSERSLERFTVYTIETTRMMLRPPVDTATIVFDMTDFSMANMDYTPVKFMIKCFEANYPESLGSVLVYRSPWIFQGIWKIIRGWLDPVVASKVHFCSHVDDLAEWIPKSQIMRELGGDEDFSYEYVEPVEGENKAVETGAQEKEKIGEERRELVKSFEGETLGWVHRGEQGTGRNRLAERLAESYWRLDPFVRARSLYDRTGVIGQGGKLNFYPKKAESAAAVGGNDELD